MSEMVERVRDAIAAALDPLIEPGRTTTLRELADGCARAAIAAMREPTAAMLKAGGDDIDDYFRGGGTSAAPPEDIYIAMIDEALK